MKKARYLFIYLSFSILLLEFAVYALLSSGNQFYLLSVFISTASMIYIAYYIIKPLYGQKETAKNYHFYFISPDRQEEDDTLFRQINKRM